MAKKTAVIIIRGTIGMKYELQKLAKESRRELSDYLRLVLENCINEKKQF
jgi:hypothetical protein